MSHTVSAIIVNYNAGPLLRACVDSLLACPLAIEIIVVDNASHDGSLGGLSELPHVRVIRNPANVGFAAACNIGVAASSAPFLLFLNPDCVVQPGAVSILLAALQSAERVGMVGGLLLNADGSEQGGGRRAVPTPWRSFVRAFGLHRFAHRWPKLFYDFHLHKQPLPEGPIEVEAISGACMLVKRAAVEDVGLWDEGYFLHCEDLDWCMRFRQKGWQILFVPDARIVHALGACSRVCGVAQAQGHGAVLSQVLSPPVSGRANVAGHAWGVAALWPGGGVFDRAALACRLGADAWLSGALACWAPAVWWAGAFCGACALPGGRWWLIRGR